MNGLIVIDKPKGFTSRDIVNIVSKKLHTKSVGHTGTLDPYATGVLVLTIGRYTKLSNMLSSLEKEYIAEIKLGIKTDTLDITGNVLEESETKVTKKQIIQTLNSFIGPYHMEVPLYSAIKVNGKKLYEYARNNENIKLPIKDVTIYELELLDFHDDIIKFKTRVEKGTYIRSLIRDICKSLNTIGTMNNLRRIKQGEFSLNNACTLEDIKNDNFSLLSIKDVMNIKEYILSFNEYQKVKNGNYLEINSKEKYLLLTYNNEEIAIYESKDNFYKVYVMLKIN